MKFNLRICSIFTVALMLALILAHARPSPAARSEDLKPEKTTLEVAIAAYSPLYLPLFVAQDAGYFSKRGVNVNLSQLSATASAQAVISGKVDIYQGGASTIHANVGGADLIYVGASVDRSTLVLFGQKELTTFESLRGKSVATTSVGAFGEIAIRKSAVDQGMEIGKDIKLVYHKGPPDAFTTFAVGNADGLIITSPHSDIAREKGYPVIIDYFERGFRIVGPGTGLARAFLKQHPNTVKIFLMGYLDGLKRTIDDPVFANSVQSKYTKISDSKLLNQGYEQGLKVWNKDMTVDAGAINIVLEHSQNPKARGLDPQRFLDNTLIREVNRDYASKLFPGEIK
ncbi:MAG: ABC transporter substrate-binding protein [Deltaproteobacteria bacterium]|nr:ABC transporter substrate-binding protein [Deltaproteobacteria bacterium]